MSRIYLMRHGETLFNVLRRKQGWCDSPLTERGIQQARDAGTWLREQGYRFDHFYSSTSERACDTMELAFPGQPYERTKGLKESYFGAFEGLTEDIDRHPFPPEFFVPFGGESEEQARERYLGTLREILGRPGHDQVLCVTHGGILMRLMRAMGVAEHLGGKRMGNCSVLVLEPAPGERFGFAFKDLLNPLG